MKSSNIGGQAVMEGIMMRSGDQYSIGVRKPDGEIEVKVEPYRSWAKDSSIWKLPVFRGVASFFESLVVGIRCLMYSASFIEDEEEDAKKPGKEKTEEQKEKYDFEAMHSGGRAVNEITLKDDEYFVLSDSRNDMDDSRNSSFTKVTKKNIIGKVILRLDPFSLIGGPTAEDKKTE